MVRLNVVGRADVRLRCRVATSRRERRRGLIGAQELGPDDALLIPFATSVHTFGMRWPILVARLDGELRVVDARVLHPGRIIGPMRHARHVLECSVRADLRVGDVLHVHGGAPIELGR